MKAGKGVAGALLYDTASSASLKTGLQQLNEASQQAAEVTKNIEALTEKIKRGEGGAGVLLSDTAFANNMKKSMHNIAESTERLDDNMEAMRSNFLFRGYFKRQEKEMKKLKADSVEAKKKEK
jgi:phospholipid/cholesterol/gamma-HCH transport system substrate-binding protein